MARSKGIRILESEKFLLVEFGTPEIFAGEIRNPNPSDKESGIHGVESRIQYCLGPLI